VPLVRSGRSLEPDAAREERARDWQRTAALAFVAALAVVAWAAGGSSGSKRGDLVAGVYFGLLAVALWAQGQRVRFARSGAPFTRAVAIAFTCALVVGMLLVFAAIASSGSI
jgi:hypothetical protein